MYVLLICLLSFGWLTFLRLVSLTISQQFIYGTFILKVRKRGVVVLPKELRTKAGIEEDCEVVAEIRGNEVLLRPLKPVIVRVDWAAVEKILGEEDEIEEEKLRKILKELRS